MSSSGLPIKALGGLLGVDAELVPAIHAAQPSRRAISSLSAINRRAAAVAIGAGAAENCGDWGARALNTAAAFLRAG